MNKISKIITNPFIKWLGIPGFLILIWFILSIIFSPYAPFRTLAYKYTSVIPSTEKSGLLLQGESLEGKFTADENNLGIIAVWITNVTPLNSDDQDNILFSLEDVSHNVQVYTHTYPVASAREGEYIVFGFPKIMQSKGITYSFTLKSLKGNETNALVVKKGNNPFITKYIFTSSDLHSRSALIEFFLKRMKVFITNSEALLFSSIYFLPFLFYITLISFAKTLKSKLGGFTISLIFISVIFALDKYSGIVLGILGLWIITVIKGKVQYQYTLIGGLFFFLLAGIWGIFEKFQLVNSASLWGYLLLCIGFTQLLIKSRKK